MGLNSIIGHKIPVKILKNVIEQNRTPHAFLFFGPVAIGKYFTAVNFARMLLCQNNSNEKGDDNCEICRLVDNNNYADLKIIDTENSQIKIDQIRDIIKEANMKSYYGNYRIFIIRDAENLNESSANSLLKIIEEPPDKNIFILTTSKIDTIHRTIRSRCLMLKFSYLKRNDIKEILIKQFNKENDEAENMALLLNNSLFEINVLSKNDELEEFNNIVYDLLKNAINGIEDFGDLLNKIEKISVQRENLNKFFNTTLNILDRELQNKLSSENTTTTNNTNFNPLLSEFDYKTIVSLLNLTFTYIKKLKINPHTKLYLESYLFRVKTIIEQRKAA